MGCVVEDRRRREFGECWLGGGRINWGVEAGGQECVRTFVPRSDY
jgi:hypothetical protein